ncbi:WG repeat-containing protein [Hwangdonia lutea]|uniref:WG repeat-containing protein n=1 Tax=Hwangdonia lutea TaxID=3075823 RepID=A0AA97ELY5_9FLAO|nr:WG repeat-containing protein [Hwangdonia sp. SCSIO 19198]WOD43707.1 WG repeat-containing protein [Hwangdonia sp. SCSIO 19198]
MKYGFINTSGKVIVPLMFSKKPENFSNGLAKVYSNEKTCSSCSQYHYSYINKKGDFVINSKDLKNSGMTFRPFVHGYAFSYLDVMDKQGTVISATDFLISFGIPKEIITNKKNISVQWDCKNIVNGKMMVSFKGIEGHTYKKYHALLDLVNKETLFYWYADAKIGPFDPVSGLAKVEEYGEKIRNNRKRIGYINENGIFMIVKGEASKW